MRTLLLLAIWVGASAQLAEALPKKAGRLTLLSTSTDRWPKEEDRHALGSYSWGAKAGNVELAAPFRQPAAQLKCDATLLIPGAAVDNGDLGCKAVKLGTVKGCLIAEDKPGTPGAMGLFLSWPGCGLQFKAGAMKGHQLSEAIDAATEIAAWSAKLRP